MKKLVILSAILMLGTSAMAQNVTIKKGKVTMTEAEYTELKSKADQFEAMSQKLTNAQNALRKERQSNEKVELKTYIDSASYAIGRDLTMSWEQQNLGINLKAVAQSISDVEAGRNTWDQTIIYKLLNRFQAEFEKRQRENHEVMIRQGEEFLANNAKQPDVKVTASGLQYKVIKKGNGKRPGPNSMLKMHYTGKLIDGTIFDSSIQRGKPIEGTPGNFIAGWTEGLQLMDEGSTYMLYIPYQLGYGVQGQGIIPPGAALIFEVQLLEVK